jgi:hypothetical protein
MAYLEYYGSKVWWCAADENGVMAQAEPSDEGILKLSKQVRLEATYVDKYKLFQIWRLTAYTDAKYDPMIYVVVQPTGQEDGMFIEYETLEVVYSTKEYAKVLGELMRKYNRQLNITYR